MNLMEEQIKLEQQMTQCSVDKYRRELEKSKQGGSFSCTSVATKLLSRILDCFTKSIKEYLKEYSKGNAVRSTLAAEVISRLNDVDSVAYLTSKIILNSIYTRDSAQRIYKAIGQGIEDEYKMRAYKQENIHYYKSIQEDLNKRGAKAKRKKNITTGVFNKRLAFHLDQWTVTEKTQTGLILVRLFVESTGLVEFEDKYEKRKHYKCLIPTPELAEWLEGTNEKLEVMQPFFIPMICPPKEWTGIFEGGYISPYLKKNKLIKNNNKEYLTKISTATMPKVYEAINHIQSTAWQVNKRVLEVVEALWEEGRAVAELPDREDTPLIPFPYPELSKDSVRTPEQEEGIKKWRRDSYEIHKSNVQKRSVRLLVSQIIRLACQFKDYEKIWFPYQMDFRGRLYPIPVLLQPQGSDLAKGLLHFAEGKGLGDCKAIEWFKIHGANVYGYDKESYKSRCEWVDIHSDEIKQYASNPLENRGWVEADKPFQFLAWCFEYSDWVVNPNEFVSHIPIQLDGTCNGLQHYSALLRDYTGGRAVNLINSEKPNDIYGVVAEKLEEKLKDAQRNSNNFRNTNNINNSSCNNPIEVRNTGSISDSTLQSLATQWLNLGINRKLTKRPVMVLPYGGTLLSCREYIGEYLTDNYSPSFIWEHFNVGNNPTDCTFKVSSWLSKYLWESIQETLQAATVGMDYLRKISRIMTSKKMFIEWFTPAGLLVRQAYPTRKHKEVKTELYGSIIKVRINVDDALLDNQRQVNGICPNFIHSLDAACLMLYINKCKKAGINSIMSVHDCYGVHASDTETSARLLREAFVEIYRQPILERFTEDVTSLLDEETELPPLPNKGELDIEEVLKSDYFFN